MLNDTCQSCEILLDFTPPPLYTSRIIKTPAKVPNFNRNVFQLPFQNKHAIKFGRTAPRSYLRGSHGEVRADSAKTGTQQK